MKQRFIDYVVGNIHRKGINDLLDWLESTDFYTAPASTRYHGAFETGLLQHSIGVYEKLTELVGFYGLSKENGFPTLQSAEESIAIVALFHDFCKINCYQTEMRWRKDANDKWEQYPTYAFNEQFAFGGHGSKSVYLVQNFIQLTPIEASAINAHMGAWDQSTYNNSSNVYSQNKLAWLLHVADEADTYLEG